MTTRKLFSLALNVAAVLAPPAALYARYGGNARVDRANGEYFVALIMAMSVTFVVGTISSMTLRRTAEGLDTLFSTLTRALQADNPSVRNRATNRAA